MDNHQTFSHAHAELALTVRSFLINNPYKKCKKMIWKYYTGWVYYHGKPARHERHADMLFFYERLKDFLKEISEIHQEQKNKI